MTQYTVQELIAMAQDESLLSQAATKTIGQMTGQQDLNARMNAAMGAPASSYKAKRVVLLMLRVDDSGSVRNAGNEQLVRDAHNEILNAVEESKQGGEVLVHSAFINGGVVNAFVPIENAERLDTTNYQATGSTPLYDTFAETIILGTAKATDFAGQLIDVQVIAITITDGKDEYSRVYRQPEDVAPIVHDVLVSEQPGFIVLGWGINDGSTDFRSIFARMGLQPNWVLTSGDSPSDIRRAARVASRSAAKASQSPASFSQTAKAGLGGFQD